MLRRKSRHLSEWLRLAISSRFTLDSGNHLSRANEKLNQPCVLHTYHSSAVATADCHPHYPKLSYYLFPIFADGNLSWSEMTVVNTMPLDHSAFSSQFLLASPGRDSCCGCATMFLFTARCTLVQSAVLRSHVVCLSVCNVGELWSHRLEFFENNFTIS